MVSNNITEYASYLMHLMQSDYIEYQWHFTVYSRRNKGLIVVNGTGSFLSLSLFLSLYRVISRLAISIIVEPG